MVESLRSPDVEEDDDCTHHWLIASPSGETSSGVCQICGASREFRNYSYGSTMSRLRKPSTNNKVST